MIFDLKWHTNKNKKNNDLIHIKYNNVLSEV